MDLNQKVFEDKTLEDVVKEVYTQHKNKESDIKSEILRISTMITNPGDAVVLLPLLKGFYDSSLKNDETLVKIVQIFQKASEASKKDSDSAEGMLTQRDIEQLFAEIPTTKPQKEAA